MPRAIRREIASRLRIQQTLKVIQPIHLHGRTVQLLEPLQIVNDRNAICELIGNGRTKADRQYVEDIFNCAFFWSVVRFIKPYEDEKVRKVHPPIPIEVAPNGVFVAFFLHLQPLL